MIVTEKDENFVTIFDTVKKSIKTIPVNDPNNYSIIEIGDYTFNGLKMTEEWFNELVNKAVQAQSPSLSMS